MTHIPFLSIYIRGIKTCAQKDWNKCAHSLTHPGQDGKADIHQQHHRAAKMDMNSGMSLSHGVDHCRKQCSVAGKQSMGVMHSWKTTANPTTDTPDMAPHPGQSGSRHSCQKSLLCEVNTLLTREQRRPQTS